MRTRSGLAAATMVLCSIGLTGCGSSGDQAAPETSTAAATQDEAPATPATTAAPEATTTPAETTDTTAQGTKPPKEQIVKALTPYFVGTPKKARERLSRCVVTNLYDEVSPQTLRQLRSGQPDFDKIPRSDSKKFTRMSVKCSKFVLTHTGAVS